MPTLNDVEAIGVDLTRIPPVRGKKDIWDRIFDFLRWLWGTTLLRLGTMIATAGVTAITGVFQVVVEWALDRYLGIQLDIPEIAGGIGWTLLAVGIGVAVLGAADQRKGR